MASWVRQLAASPQCMSLCADARCVLLVVLYKQSRISHPTHCMQLLCPTLRRQLAQGTYAARRQLGTCVTLLLPPLLLAGKLDKVLEVYKDMVVKGLERSVITYSSLISACEKAGQWETALQLFEESQRDGCTPNTVTYNSLITACAQGEPGMLAPEPSLLLASALACAGCREPVCCPMLACRLAGLRWLLDGMPYEL
jgi:pentatricopeptide repeat protein